VKLWWPGAVARMNAKGYKAKISMDNPNFQKYAKYGIRSNLKIDLPKYSPDMHKVVEHIFARLKPLVYEEMYRLDHPATAQEVQGMVRRIFNCEVPDDDPDKSKSALLKEQFRKSIEEDSESLVNTYRVIATDAGVMFMDEKGKTHIGVGGDWPPGTYR